MSQADYWWSMTTLVALVSTLIPCLLLLDEIPVWSALSVRRLWSLRCLNYLAVSALATWPVALTPALRQAPLMAIQDAALLGLAAFAVTIQRNFVMVPVVIAAALTVLPGALPAPWHPITVSAHPPSTLWLQAAAWLAGGLSWVLIGERRRFG